MANPIVTAFEVTYRETDGSPETPHKPVLAEARAIGPVIAAEITLIGNGVALGAASVYETLAAANADLANIPAGKLVVVWGDPDPTKSKIYAKKSGALQATNLTFGSDAALQLATLQGQVDGKAEKAVTIGVGGLATGGGTLAANRTITVPKASAAEVAAKTDDAKAVTPLALAPTLATLAGKQEGFKTLRITTTLDFIERPPTDIAAATLDPNGRISSYKDTAGGGHDYEGSPGDSYSKTQTARHSAEAQRQSAAIHASPLKVKTKEIERKAFNVIGGAGQSLIAGAQQFGDIGPMTAIASIWMIGQSTRPDETNTGRWRSAGGAHGQGSASGANVVTITDVEGNGLIKVGAVLIGANVTLSPPTTIVEQLTQSGGDGPGRRGTYRVNQAQTFASTYIIFRDTRDDRLLPLIPTVRYSEALETVLIGGQSLGSPPYSDNPANPNWRRLIAYERANLGFSVLDFFGRYFKQDRNRMAFRPDSYVGEDFIVGNAGVGATGMAEWGRLTAANDYNAGTTYGRGARVRWTATPYGAATLTAGSSTGNPPPGAGEGVSNAYWSIGTDCFNRLYEFLVAAKANANAMDPSKAVFLLLLFMLQGTNDSPRGATYYADLMAFVNAVRVIEKEIYGAAQTDPSTIFIYAEQVNQAGFTLGSTVWNSGVAYATGAIVDAGGFFWMSLQDGNTNHTPLIGSTWWNRLSDWAIWRSDKSYANYDWVTYVDGAYRSRVNGNKGNPPVVGGVVDAVNWQEITAGGSWCPAGIKVDDAKLQALLDDPTIVHIGSGYAAWQKRRVHGNGNWPKHVASWAREIARHVLSNRRTWRPTICYEARIKKRDFLLKWWLPKGGLQIRPVFRDVSNPIILPHWGISIYDAINPLPMSGQPDGTNPIYKPSQGIPIGSYEMEISESHAIRGVLDRNFEGITTFAFADPGRSYSMTNIFDGADWGGPSTYTWSSSESGYTTYDMHQLEEVQNEVPLPTNNPAIPRTLVAIRD